MILYNGQSLTVKDKFRPESMSLTLEERKSQASLTIGPDAPEIFVGDWMRDDTEPGSGILWRVKSVSDQVEKQTRTVALEHISATLRDCVIFGEWEPEGGCTAQAAVNYALAQTGGLWELGDWEVANPTNPYKFASTTVFGAIETVSASVSGVFWEYDLSSIPFRLHMRLISDSAASEMRMSRNILSLKRSVDRSRMYTRIYPIGADDLHITGDYLSKNENIYGRVDHIETDQSKDSAAELQRWAQERLNTHCEPAVSIQISGLDYSRETGEALDALAIGTRCRVPLPEYGTTILETLTRLQWKDKIAKPEEVTANLANIQEDVASIFRQVSGGAASNTRAGGRGAKKKKEEDHAWFVDTTDHVAMVAEAIVGTDEEGDLWSRVSALVVDGTGIHSRVTATENGVAAHGTAIEQDERAISLAVGTYQIDPDKILRYAGKSQFPQTGQTGWYYLDTAVTPNRMYVWKDGQYNLLQVSGDGEKGFLLKAGDIAIALNESGEAEAHIDAKKVILGASQLTQGDLDTWAYGAETGEGVFAKYLTVKRLTAQEISTMLADIGSADLGGLSVDGQANFSQGVYIGDEDELGFLEVDGPVTATSFQISGSGDYLATLNVVDAALSNDGKTLYIWKAGDDDESPSITFRKATTLNGAWSGGGHLLTISTDTDANINYKVAFDAPAQTANQYMEVEVGTVTALGVGYISTPINVNTVVYGSGEDDDTVTTRYTKTWIEDISSLLENMTGATGASPRITANGTYGPGSGYVGIGSVIVDVPSKITKGTWSNGDITFSATATGSNSAGISLDAADASWSGNVATVAIYDGDPGGGGQNTGFSVQVNASGRYTAGQNSVTINKGSWSNGQISFTKSAGTASTQSVNLDADDPTWNGNVATVAIYDGDPGGSGVSTGYSVTVNATARYNAGWDYGITSKIANATPASKTLSFGESVTANVVGVKSDGTLSQLCWATFTAPSPSTPVISLPSALPNSPTSSAEALRYNNIPISASADGLSASANLSLGAGLFYNGTTQDYCMNLYSSTNQSGNVIGRISIQQLLDNQWIAGAQSVINAGGPYTAGPGEYTLNQYVTTLTVTGSSGGDIDISSQNWYNSGDILPAADATLNTSGGYITKNKRGYLYFKVTSTGEATKVYRIPIDTT